MYVNIKYHYFSLVLRTNAANVGNAWIQTEWIIVLYREFHLHIVVFKQ